MEKDLINKYVGDLDGLLNELSSVQAIPAIRVDEKGVIFLFGRIFRFLNFSDVSVGHEKAGDLDAWAWSEKEAADVILEFEFNSRNFAKHGHDPDKCDLIVCWNHNWKECPKHIDVLELKPFWEKSQKLLSEKKLQST